MNHAIRIPEMGVSKVPLLSAFLQGLKLLCYELLFFVNTGLCDFSKCQYVCGSSSMQRCILTRSSRATCWWTREARMGRWSMATASYRWAFCLRLSWKEKKPELSRYHVNDTFICSPKPSLSLMHWCTAMKWRWERLCCPSISIQGTIPVMAVSPVRWWLTSASTREKTTLVSYLKWNTSTERGISFFFFFFCIDSWNNSEPALVVNAVLFPSVRLHSWVCRCCFLKVLLSPKRIKNHCDRKSWSRWRPNMACKWVQTLVQS